MRGYRQPAWKLWCFVVLAVLTAGLSLLACHWFPRLRIWLTLSPCPLADAQYVVIKVGQYTHHNCCIISCRLSLRVNACLDCPLLCGRF